MRRGYGGGEEREREVGEIEREEVTPLEKEEKQRRCVIDNIVERRRGRGKGRGRGKKLAMCCCSKEKDLVVLACFVVCLF